MSEQVRCRSALRVKNIWWPAKTDPAPLAKPKILPTSKIFFSGYPRACSSYRQSRLLTTPSTNLDNSVEVGTCWAQDSRNSATRIKIMPFPHLSPLLSRKMLKSGWPKFAKMAHGKNHNFVPGARAYHGYQQSRTLGPE